MKKLILLVSLFACLFVIQAQTPDVAIDTTAIVGNASEIDVDAVNTPIEDIETTVIDEIWAAIMTIIGYIDWVLMVTFLAICWLTLPLSEGTNIASWFNWWAKIPKLLQSLVVGILTTCAFWFMFDYSGKAGIITAFFTLLLDMILYRIGIDKAIKWIFSKLGVKFA